MADHVPLGRNTGIRLNLAAGPKGRPWIEEVHTNLPANTAERSGR